ncbi:hypothetical protein G9A89_004510 [Geosiphon pyriformis]|nr:hypothetical protein G9A89_004510 [Geosiphon pyriformis]
MTVKHESMTLPKPLPPIIGMMPELFKQSPIFFRMPLTHANIFITIEQGETETVTTYLGHFHRNLHQIQTIQVDYFTVPQILNQFIRGLYSSILQCIHLLHPADLQAAITNARDFEAAELEANHAQAINLVMNRSFELNSKLKQFSNSINQKLEGYLADN